MVTKGDSAMIVTVEKPITWLRSKRDGDRHRLMYKNLLSALLDMNLEVHEIPIEHGHDFANRSAPSNGFSLSYHSVGYSRYVWRIKETSIPFFYSIDRRGHSGWSELSGKSQEYTDHLTKVKSVDDEVARLETRKIRNWLESNNLSKYEQKDVDYELPEDFVFFPLQTLNDPVRIHDRLDPVDVLVAAAGYAKKSQRHLVVKRHPYCQSIRVALLLNWICLTNPFVRSTNMSVAKLLPSCRCVLVGNSGVGLEALIYGKNVHTFSASEYEMVTHKIETLEDIGNVFENTNDDSSPEIDRFVWYFLHSVCFDARDKTSIKSRIELIISDVKTGNWN
jgi:hypothetical protein